MIALNETQVKQVDEPDLIYLYTKPITPKKWDLITIDDVIINNY